MAPLTSLPGCQSCADLSKKICELEQRISTLYKIQDAEKFLDTIIFGSAPATSGAELGDTIPVALSAADEAPIFPGTVAPAAVAAPATRPMPVSNYPDHPWVHMGAKPKASTFCHLFILLQRHGKLMDDLE